MGQSPEWHPERYRDLVRIWARELHLDPRLQRRFDGSDLTQETMLKAHDKIGEFRGTTEAELLKWLHTILLNQLRDQIEHEKAARRNFELEQALPEVVAESSARIDQWLAASQSSPSEQAERHEQELRLAAALAQLPEDQRDVVIMHKLMKASVAETASQTKRSEKAVAGLLRRAMQKLGQILKDNQ
jgi:RNA polymerase sigma-70 factor (ECF subfamily)